MSCSLVSSSSEERHITRRRLSEDGAERYHPDKSQVDCESFWQEHGTNNNNNNNHTRHRHRHLFSFESVPDEAFDLPCRGDYYDLIMPTTQQSQEDGKNQGSPPPPPPEQEEEGEEDGGELVIPPHVIPINISVAIDYQKFGNGIPRRLTMVVEEYLNTTNVTLAFLSKEYSDGRHFIIDIIQPPNSNSKANSNTQPDNNTLPFIDNNNTNTNATALLQDAETLHLAAVSSRQGHLVGHANNTPFAWYYHIVYLAVHEEEERPNRQLSSIATSSNNNNIQPVDDAPLMAWLQVELQGIIYADILLQGPLGPYYDTNNYHDQDNFEARQISYIEWSLQADGFPIGGVAIPGHEDFDLQEQYRPPPPKDDDTVPPQPTTPAPTTSSDDDDQVIYYQPLSLTATSRQWWGLACLLTTLIAALVLTVVSNELAKRREREELWGNLLKAAQEDVEYLDVGWRFQEEEEKEEEDDNNYMTMQVFDKKGVGYRDGSSILLGGYEYKSTTALQQQQNETSSSSTVPRANHQSSYRVDPSVTPFG
ncbi:expressed unknown protein [Seminavis robusta]|uniref:Uncharacterized protein n=1 Tax=Seminavis robusta TaxID=568900 RepID=A0A9N8E0N6_9STRA|nr:expressed unknown protein [Seminavis robusta]|eukprot:Sro528_g160860.1 n/a (536) ;mRNA; r:39479-41086